MSYEIRFEQKDTYLHATVTGTNSRDNVLAYMADISRECDRRQCFRVLIEERLDGPRLATLDIFAIASEGSLRVLGMFEAVAYVDVYGGELMDFADDPRFFVRWDWQVDDLAIWDERSTMHRVDASHWPEPRRMRRCTIS